MGWPATETTCGEYDRPMSVTRAPCQFSGAAVPCGSFPAPAVRTRCRTACGSCTAGGSVRIKAPHLSGTQAFSTNDCRAAVPNQVARDRRVAIPCNRRRWGRRTSCPSCPWPSSPAPNEHTGRTRLPIDAISAESRCLREHSLPTHFELGVEPSADVGGLTGSLELLHPDCFRGRRLRRRLSRRRHLGRKKEDANNDVMGTRRDRQADGS